jgi:Tfp pilus assembly protein PilO
MAKIKKEKKEAKISQIIIVRFYWVIVLVLFIGALLFEYFVLIKPELAELSNGGRLDLSSRQEILKEQKEYLNKLQELKVQAEKINRAELEKINYVLAEKIDVPDILKQIKILGEQSGLTLTGFEFETVAGVLTLKMNFEKGTYPMIKKYLSEIEKNIRIMDVKEISLIGIGNKLSLTLESYYLEN